MFRSIGVGWLLAGVLTACAATGSTLVPTSTARPAQASPAPLLIVTLGDSLTYGDKDEESGGGWPRRVRLAIATRRPAVRVINLALPGWTSHDLLQGRDGAPNQIDEAVQVLREAPGEKIAAVWIGTNDLFYLYEGNTPTSGDEAREVARFERDLAELLDQLKGAGARVFIALLHDPSQGAAQTSGVFTSITATEWAQLSQQAQRYNEIIKAIAAKHGATLVDIPATKIFTTPTLMYEDGIHPNARGYDELARVWHDALGK